jgi:hypothetical protein
MTESLLFLILLLIKIREIKRGIKMLKKFLLVSVLAFSIFFNSCATYVKVKLLKPAEISLGPIRKIAISDFTFEGKWDSDETTSLGAVAGQIITDAIFDSFGKKNNRGLPDPLKAYPGSQISDNLLTKLTENRFFKYIRRLPENFDYSGKLRDIDAIISGKGNYIVTDRGEWVDDITTKNGITIRNKKFKVNRTVFTEITFNIKNTDTGELIATKTNSDSTSRSETGDDEDEARKKLTDWHYMVENNVDNILDTSVIQIAPHYIYEEREIKDGKAPEMKTGMEYAKRYLWDDARKSWEIVLSKPVPEFREDIINANYNLGIYYEVFGDFDKAGSFFDECYKRTGKSEFLDAKSRVNFRKYEVEKLRVNNNIQ